MRVLSILQRELQPCVILELGCTNCGPVRMAISSNVVEKQEVGPQNGNGRSHFKPPRELGCPYCNEAAPATMLGTGQTRRLLPYFDLAPNVTELDQIPQASDKMRPIVQGQIICFSEDPDIIHFAKVKDVFTSRAHVSHAGRPSVSFVIHGEETDAIPHFTGAGGERPWWSWPDELKMADCPNRTSACVSAEECTTECDRRQRLAG